MALRLGTRGCRHDYGFARQGFLRIVALKEKHQDQRVRKIITIHSHMDSLLCPVVVSEEYKHRIASVRLSHCSLFVPRDLPTALSYFCQF
ncbi:hypothetical protein BCV72DRAFT_224721 [Rhizopus microsporus var. microsporus]|uniref:Uncharacterized protein n=1 Tax=Rhizopus microsporus var. microsporus TaxID=86635 RepID=A0A1X0R9P6_RHIZD|nr:hypothetical protein BCV72DRAFT_224721 [Rhizopus microsporus var. microsporus]